MATHTGCRRTVRLLQLLSLLASVSSAAARLDCDPNSNQKKPDPDSPESYLYCNLEGSFSRRRCVSGKVFDDASQTCQSIAGDSDDDPFLHPQFQAPDDLCGAGIPLTILSAPVVCNPSISSCPDGYVCRAYSRTGTSYCCQNGNEEGDDGKAVCPPDQIMYIEPSSSRPRSCVIGQEGACPVGFGCNQVGGGATRCCGKDFGCPKNSAGYIRASSGSHVECSPGDRKACPSGFGCMRSSVFQTNICCSLPEIEGEEDMQRVCPAGEPLGNSPRECSADRPCPEGHDCVTSNGDKYCCPNRNALCTLSRHSGSACPARKTAVTRYYFDKSTGSCRSFKYSQCGGNGNNFGSIEECEGFCVDRQCQQGQAYRVGAVNVLCSLASQNTCPKQHNCQQPLFGPNAICCPTQELTCNEMVSAGTPCFGRSMTVQRFYFNPITRRCASFQYYGCSGNGNNFASEAECMGHCATAVDSVCGGVAPLLDPSRQAQRCTEEDGCPRGYTCNENKYCCPTTETACSTPMSRGDICSGSARKTQWYYDEDRKKCTSFLYNGCGGSSNRFTSQKACREMCVQVSAVGQCPRGMNPHIPNGQHSPQTCTLNVMGTCPSSSSCVRSSTHTPICCRAVTTCPEARTPYTIPGSSSVVACNIDADECPDGNTCVESSSAPGFHMCCSNTGSAVMRPPGRQQGRTTKRPRTKNTKGGSEARDVSPCPPGLASNGETCTVNAIGDCTKGHLCFREVGFSTGSCCATAPPKCTAKDHTPVFISRTQVQLCQSDLAGCPSGSRCMTSSVPTAAICCKQGNRKQPMATPRPSLPVARPDKNSLLCRNGEVPFKAPNGVFVQCNFVQNTCPPGYKCDFSSTGQPVCCNDIESVKCPAGASPFEYGGRPLACPKGSTKCPQGFQCLPSANPRYHLCCSTAPSQLMPQCARGVAYVDPVSNMRQYCSPLANNCPAGFHCLESSMRGQFICCTNGDLADRFKGYCPPRQLPHVDLSGSPRACHMTLNPCPTTAAYVCIYSAERMDSYCCAPIDTAVRPMNNMAHPGYAGMGGAAMGGAMPGQPMRRLPNGPDNYPGSQLPENQFGGFNGQNQFPQNQFGQQNQLPQNQFNQQQNQFGQSQFGQQNQLPPQNQFGQGAMVQQPPQQVKVDPIIINGKTGEVLHGPAGVEVRLQSTTESSVQTLVSTDSKQYSGCPSGTRTLVDMERKVATCHASPCPDGFSCVYAEAENRWQCCSAGTIMLRQLKTEQPPPTEDSSSYSSSSSSSSSAPIECPFGFNLVDGKCLKVLYVGQKGCNSDEQCAAKEANATCSEGYCICPASKPLVHSSKCVADCPAGFSNIAGRCYDPTTVIFMDSVDERANGTIGGYCLETLVEEKRCHVENAYCSEKTVTCTCKPGFELKMDFDNKGDKGLCVGMDGSKFVNGEKPADEREPDIDGELFFVDIGPGPSPSLPLEGSGEMADDDVDPNRYLFQSDMVGGGVFA